MNDRQVLKVGHLAAARGERVTGFVDVDLGPVVAAVPVAVVHGARPGPVMGVQAGIHGSEYVCIEALQRVVSGLDPKEMTGSLIAAMIASPLAFAQRSVYFNPADGGNPNRSFPGDHLGAPSQRLSAWIAANIIDPSDAYVDMHGGDMNEALVPFTLVTTIGDPEHDAQAQAMAQAYALDYAVTMPLAPNTDPRKYSSAQHGGSKGIPSMLAEVGGQGLRPEADVAQHANGLMRTLSSLGIAPHGPHTQRPATTHLSAWVWEYVEAGGCWHPSVAVGDQVKAGDQLGTMRDPFGNVLEAVVAQVSGVVLFMVTGLAVNAGDHVLALGV